MIEAISKVIKIYIGILTILLIIMISSACFSSATEDKCYICGQRGVPGEDLDWQRVRWKYYDYPSRKFRTMNTPGPLCKKCEKIEKAKKD